MKLIENKRNITTNFDYNVKVDDVVLGNDGTVDFCMTIENSVVPQATNITVAKPLVSTNCGTCPVYKKYTANACDGSEQNR